MPDLTLQIRRGRTQPPDVLAPAALGDALGVIVPLIRNLRLNDAIGSARITAIDDAGVHVEVLTHEVVDIGLLTPAGTVTQLRAIDGQRVITGFRLAAISAS